MRPLSAQAPEDFDDSPANVIFEPNKNAATVTIPIKDNEIIDDDRTFEVTLELSGTLGTIDPDHKSATVTVKNDDGN